MKLCDYDRQILQHIIRYADEIDETISKFGKDESLFREKHWYRNAVSMAILQIGELANALTNDLRDARKEIPWRAVIGMRNRFAHSYGNMNLHTVWLTAIESVPDLREKCQKILDDCIEQEGIIHV